VSVRNGENERMQREELEQVQLERLQSTLNRAYKNVTFYKKQFDEHGILPGAVSSVQDIAALPFTTRKDLGDNYPYGLFAVPLRDIVRISPSSGTTLKPVVIGYTKGDLKVRDTITARFLEAGGVTEADIVQICLNPGLSGWGRALKEGAEYIGASVMPMSNMSTKKQLMAMEDYKTSALLTTPSYALHILDVMEAIAMDKNRLALKAILVAGETLTEEGRKTLRTALGAAVTAGYGPSDVTGPGVAFECGGDSGLHVSEDHFVLEIVDPQTGRPCPQGQQGEVVLTTLTAKAFPLIRFRTGDMACAITAPCSCGRTFFRISPITGHTGEILTIRGVKAHPSQIAQMLEAQTPSGVTPPRFLVHVFKESHLDMIEVWLEMTGSLFSDEVKEVEATLMKLRKQMFQTLGLEVTIKMMEAATLDRFGLPSGGVVDDR
jgi:phenylacetate-CoA ligase